MKLKLIGYGMVPDFIMVPDFCLQSKCISAGNSTSHNNASHLRHRSFHGKLQRNVLSVVCCFRYVLLFRLCGNQHGILYCVTRALWTGLWNQRRSGATTVLRSGYWTATRLSDSFRTSKTISQTIGDRRRPEVVDGRVSDC